MKATESIDRYLGLFRTRLQQLTLSRGLATIAVVALAITLVAVSIAIRSGFPGDLMLAARLILLGAIAGLSVAMIVLPNRRIDADGIAEIEGRLPAFGGRITTYAEMSDDDNPLRELLAEDAARIAEQHPPERGIPQKEINLAGGIAGAAFLALVLLGIAGPGNYGYGVRDLWLGWAFPGVVPPQSIQVSPGNDGIRAGGTVRVRAVAQGFSPTEAFVHARFGDDDWQRVSMARRDDGFEFTFFSVREPLDYYVSAASVRSETYQVAVVDLPNIDRLTNTYEFPEWTGREPETRDPGGDVRTVADTEVTVDITGSDALTPGVLVVDDEEIELDIDGVTGTASFTVSEDGQYYVAAIVGGERIRLTDDYFVSVLEDEAPEIEFAKPGRDWSASPIEEVTARISVQDDFRVESLAILYSVNGGEWKTVDLPSGMQSAESEHVFYLESLLDDEQPPVDLVPGDLVSYYAVAEDRENTARTDIFFVDVQPFDKRYSQSQMSGGGQQGGGQPQNEISQRQREIIVSTWNLIREQQENKRDDDAYVPNNAALLSRLQATLRDQAQTLAERTRARMLTASDEKIAEFVENLDLAAEAMVPASERLAEIDLEQAILPEQEALQHLLRAEAVFTDINVSMQANNRGGGGGQAGRDLTDMFELEMDLEKNQYETGSRATPDAPQEQLDEIGDELEELARRQEQLANRLNRQQQPTPAERWQQDLLRREAEELRQRLERMQQAANNQSSSSQQQSGRQQGGQSSGSSQSSSSSQSSESGEGDPSQQQSASNDRQQREMDQLRRRLDSAVRAMNEADQAMRDGADPEALRRAANEAQRQLEGARDQAAAEQQRLMQAELDELGERANDAYETQADMEERLQAAIRNMLTSDENDNRLDSGLTFTEEMEMARAKRELQGELQSLAQDVNQAASELSGNSPEAADELERALSELREQEVDARLSIAASYIEQGEAVYVSGSESAVTESLRDFTQALRRASALAAGDQDGENPQRGRGLAETLADTQAVRRELQRLAEAGDAANRSDSRHDDRQDNRERSEQNGQQSDSDSPGSNQGEAQVNSGGDPTMRSDRVSGWGRDDLQQSTGIVVPDLQVARELDRNIDNLSDDVLNLFRQLRESGVPEPAIDELRRLAADVRASDFSGNEALLERESRAALTLVEQLELALARAAREQTTQVRATPAERVPDEHREPVANYFRRLGEDRDASNNDDQ